MMAFLYQQTILFLTTVHHIQTYPSSLVLGFLGPTNLPNINTQVGGHPALRAFKLAIRDINNRSDLLPHTNLTYVINSTNSDVGNATVEAFWQCVYGNVIGLVGEYISAISQVEIYCRFVSIERHYFSLFSMSVAITKFLRFLMVQHHRNLLSSILSVFPIFSAQHQTRIYNRYYWHI